MNKWIVSAALICGAAQSIGVATAKPSAKASKAAKAKAPIKSLAVCPVMQHEVARDPKNSRVYANTTVYFCCGGCRANFNKMTPSVQKARFQAALKLAASKKKA